MKLLAIIALFLIVVGQTNAQLVTTMQDPTALVNNVLLGDPNITVTNITYQGAPSAIGSFTAANTNLGISNGIVMTTGTILNTGNGPQGPNNVGNAGVDNNTPGYPLLSNIVGAQTYNATVLSFDFSTCSDSIEFKYVFGSEEYPEYVGSQFNDVFGFFISGPGFSGQQNIARLPNGSVVAINSVNNGNNQPAPGQNPTGPTNPQYFVMNGNGDQAPYNSSPLYIQYDGFTRVLTAKAKIECNATYRLTLAIADVGDPIYDSGIFLEAKSFKANDPVKITYTLTNQMFPEPNVLAEPCAEAIVRVERTECSMNTPLTLNISTFGQAINGVDYQSLPPTITIPAGSTFTTFNVKSLLDNIVEGTENLIIRFNYNDNCGDAREQEIELFIRDTEPLVTEIAATESICPGDNVTLTAIGNGGNGNFTYQWNTGETTQTIVVNPLFTTTYTVEITEECSGTTITRTITVPVQEFTPFNIETSPDIVELCPYVPHTIFANVTGGLGTYTYQWLDENGATIGHSNSLNISPDQTTTYTFIVRDQCGLTDTARITYTITSPKLVVNIAPIDPICPGDMVELIATATGGYGAYYYHWPHSGETTSSVWVNPLVSTNYIVVVSDECQTFSVAQIAHVIVQKPSANFNPSSTVLFNNLEITFENLSSNASSYEWTFGDGQSSTATHPNNIYDNPGQYIVTLIAIDDKGCRDTIAKPIIILEEYYIYVPNTFTPLEDRINDVFKVSTVNIDYFDIKIFNRWGELIFHSKDANFEWDGTYEGYPVQDGTFTYKIDYTSRSGVEGKLVGHINLLR